MGMVQHFSILIVEHILVHLKMALVFLMLRHIGTRHVVMLVAGHTPINTGGFEYALCMAGKVTRSRQLGKAQSIVVMGR